MIQSGDGKMNMPFLLKCGMYFSFLFAVAALVGIVLMAIGFGTWRIADQSYDAYSALKLAGPMLFVSGTLMGGIGLGIYHRKKWARTLVLIFWIWVPLYVSMVAYLGYISWIPAFRPLIQSAVCLPFSWWYLYRRAAVELYFNPKPSAQL